MHLFGHVDIQIRFRDSCHGNGVVGKSNLEKSLRVDMEGRCWFQRVYNDSLVKTVLLEPDYVMIWAFSRHKTHIINILDICWAIRSLVHIHAPKTGWEHQYHEIHIFYGFSVGHDHGRLINRTCCSRLMVMTVFPMVVVSSESSTWYYLVLLGFTWDYLEVLSTYFWNYLTLSSLYLNILGKQCSELIQLQQVTTHWRNLHSNGKICFSHSNPCKQTYK